MLVVSQVVFNILNTIVQHKFFFKIFKPGDLNINPLQHGLQFSSLSCNLAPGVIAPAS